MRTIKIGLCIATLGLMGGCGPSLVDRDGRGGALVIGTPAPATLGINDPAMVLPGRSASTMYRADVWTVSLTAGSPVTFAMCEDLGSDFDPYLVVESSGMDNHTNDDSGGGYHNHGSLLSFTPTVTGTYQVYASTFRTLTGDTVGDYTLQAMAGDMSSTFHCPGN